MGTAVCFTCGIIVAAVFIVAMVVCIVKTLKEDTKGNAGKGKKTE